MTAVLIVLAVLAVIGGAAGAAAQETPGKDAPPVFRADAYVVAIDYAPVTGAPMLGLTSKDFLVTIDKRIPVTVVVVADPLRPGFYRITFSPPESLRDGKTHKVDVARPNKKAVRFQMKFEKPKVNDDDTGKAVK